MDMYPPPGGGAYPPDNRGYPPIDNGYGQTAQPPRYEPPRTTPNYGSDYPPNLATEYRNGFEIGQKDASVGYPRDSRRAYERFGGGYESYFQEGYADGFDGRQMAH
jgi:hypothetical protein